MSDISDLSKLSFFSVTEYTQNNGYVCDFTGIPRPHYCVGLILEGRGDFEFAGKTVVVNKGDIIFVPIGSTYASHWSGCDKAVYISAHFSFETHDLFSRNKKIEIQKVTLPDYPDLKSKFEKMYAAYNGNKTQQLVALGTFYEIISMVCSQLIYTKTTLMDKRIEKAVEFIEEHFTQQFTIEQLAKLSNMSVSHFHECFKSQVGCSAITYKHNMCVRKAQILLTKSDLSIEEISETLGFNSSVYFREVFKKTTGKSPSEYRKEFLFEI
ncbi:MAG: AraC family transcriptional regulator [Acutalibacteraceae bacterium]|nr:AraC family transcriptional regulator [Acutalibacteraceae bacterium]